LSRDGYRKEDRAKRSAPQQGRRRLLFLLLFAAAVLLGAVLLLINRGAAGESPFNYTELLMDTEVSLQLFGRKEGEARRVKETLFEEMRRLEQLLSCCDPQSEIFEINHAAGKKPVAVSPETAEVMQEALHYAAISEGAFDPTIAPLLELWGFREGDYRVPAPDELAQAGGAVDYRSVEAGGGEVYLPRRSMALDLGGIAKGYIIDCGLALLARSGVSHALINAGGDVGILGPKADGSPWKIGLKHPRSEKILAVIPRGERGAVVTSGDYERFFEKDGVRYHHILDPRTGRPASSLISVTVVAPTAVQADALSTALFVMGPERGLALVEDLPGVEALLVTPQQELLLSSGLRDLVELPGDGG
jgi:thiamine biosynthesis lipoprotein